MKPIFLIPIALYLFGLIVIFFYAIKMDFLKSPKWINRVALFLILILYPISLIVAHFLEKFSNNENS